MSAPPTPAPLGFGARLALAFKLLFNGALAGRLVRGLHSDPPIALPPPEVPVLDALPELPRLADPTPALQLLAILQREGRLLDFLQEDVTAFSDVEIGAAARVVHDGCKKGLAEYLDVAPVRRESEGDAVVLAPGFDAVSNRVTGNVVGEPPYRGRLAHHGWRVTATRLPKVVAGHDPHVVAPAEIEL